VTINSIDQLDPVSAVGPVRADLPWVHPWTHGSAGRWITKTHPSLVIGLALSRYRGPVTSLTAEAASFFSSTLLVPEGTVRPWGFPGATDAHAVSTGTFLVGRRPRTAPSCQPGVTVTREVGATPRAPIYLTAEAASPLGAF
jgi:hypothetical protein